MAVLRPRPAHGRGCAGRATRRGEASRSAYNPTISGDGRLVAFETYQHPERVGVAHRRRRARHALRRDRAACARPPARATRPSRGSRPTAAASRSPRWCARPARERSEVFVQDLAPRARAARLASRRGGVGAGALGATARGRRTPRPARAAARWSSSATSAGAAARRSPRPPGTGSPSSRRCPRTGAAWRSSRGRAACGSTQVFVRDVARTRRGAARFARRRSRRRPRAGHARSIR